MRVLGALVSSTEDDFECRGTRGRRASDIRRLERDDPRLGDSGVERKYEMTTSSRVLLER